MTAQAKIWRQVGENFESLGTHLRSHFDDVSAEASAERAAMEKSIRGLLAALDNGFDAARDAVHDAQLRDDVTSVGTAVREALLATFESAGTQVRERLAPKAKTGAAPAGATSKPAGSKASKTTGGRVTR